MEQQLFGDEIVLAPRPESRDVTFDDRSGNGTTGDDTNAVDLI